MQQGSECTQDIQSIKISILIFTNMIVYKIYLVFFKIIIEYKNRDLIYLCFHKIKKSQKTLLNFPDQVKLFRFEIAN